MGEVIAEKISVQRRAARAIALRSQSSPNADEALQKLYEGAIALERCRNFDAKELLDIEMLRDRLSRIYDKARGVE